MTLVRFKNQTEYAFVVWMDNHPESFHPLDMQRFYTFVQTVARYRSKKWRNYEYFKHQVVLRRPHFSEEHIDHFFDLMHICLDYHAARPIDSTTHSGGGYGYIQVGVKDGKIYEIDITEKEFLKHGRRV